MGIPDGQNEKVLMQSFRMNTNLVVPPHKKMFVVQVPIVGHAYSVCLVNEGNSFEATNHLEPIIYDGYLQLFGQKNAGTVHLKDATANIVTRVRLASNSFELVPTTNEMNWYGSIKAFKTKVQQSTFQADTGATVQLLTGLEALNATGVDMYVAPSNMGVFMNGYNNAKEWNRTDVKPGISAYPQGGAVTTDFYGFYDNVIVDGADVGVGPVIPEFETNVVVVENPSDTPQTFIVRTWQCAECSPVVNTLLYAYAKDSAPLDELALQIYHDLGRRCQQQSHITKMLPFGKH